MIEKIVRLNNQIEDYEAEIKRSKKDKEDSERKYEEEIRVLEEKIESLVMNSIESTEEDGESIQ